MSRRSERAEAARKAQALRESIRLPAEPVIDVAGLVAAELDRRRAAEADQRRQAEEARFVGGPCHACGDVTSFWVERDGTRSPGWATSSRGLECAACTRWRTGSDVTATADDLLDLVAATLQREGLGGLADPNRSHFSGIRPGLAAELGVIGWRDSGLPPGERWSHLAEIASRLDQERERPRTGVTNGDALAAYANRAPAENEHLQRVYLPGRGWLKPWYTPEEAAELEAAAAADG